MNRHSAYHTSTRPNYETAGIPAELEILKLFATYDLLSTDYVYHALNNWQSTRKHLTNLVKGLYIGFPSLSKEEKLAYIPRNGHYIFELKPRGKALCALRDIPIRTPGNDHFLHKLLRSKLEFLLDRGPLQVVSPEDILYHERCPKSTRQAPFPFRLPGLEPDITRGFRDAQNPTSGLFIHVEVDRGTEVVEEGKDANKRQTLRGKVRRYVQYIKDHEYETRFGFVVPPSVLFLTTRQNTTALRDIIEDEAEGYYSRFYTLSIPKNPLPTHNLFAPWQGIDGALDLMEKLHGRVQESGAGEPVGGGD